MNRSSLDLVDALKAQREELLRIRVHVVNRKNDDAMNLIDLARIALDRAIEPESRWTAVDGAFGKETRLTELHPVLRELISMLPAPDTEFRLEQRRAWLEAMAAAFTLVYPSPSDEVQKSLGLGYKGRQEPK